MIELGRNFLNLTIMLSLITIPKSLCYFFFFYVWKNLDPTCNESTHNKLVTIYLYF
jgi:hypothetical protein